MGPDLVNAACGGGYIRKHLCRRPPVQKWNERDRRGHVLAELIAEALPLGNDSEKPRPHNDISGSLRVL